MITIIVECIEVEPYAVGKEFSMLFSYICFNDLILEFKLFFFIGQNDAILHVKISIFIFTFLRMYYSHMTFKL